MGSGKRSSNSAVSGVPARGAGAHAEAEGLVPGLRIQRHKADYRKEDGQDAGGPGGGGREGGIGGNRGGGGSNYLLGGNLQPLEYFFLTQRITFWTGTLNLNTWRDKRVK